ncbi:hypothetical protein [Actinokineospora bangkokensis]|uniref:Methylaspartate mutase n=1 Tax=Actinokineospora bangkokensis TaxID=1193682 RepID=A0A1Q9LRJ1_9PSEU|nr:hypothetical protein [Actinokineospora bangkokensis]OLR94645.1 hypothetical protein BJP25_13045 [Actinokineospora bangkokensis]
MPGRGRGLGADIGAERARLLARHGEPGLDPATAREHLAALPADRFASVLFARPRSRPLVQPRGGFPTAAKQRALTEALHEAGADFLPLTIDSHTRHNAHGTAAELLAAGVAEGRDLLNGYPLVAHGVRVTRELFAGIDRPVSLRHGTPDARLLAELALASGITEVEGGGLCYSLPYSRAFPLERALVHWQYVDRLCATAGPPERPVHRESFGPLTATLVPPVVAVVVQLCELLLAAEQGVTSFTVSFGQTGSVEQDLAVADVLRSASGKWLARFGFTGVQVRLAYHQWMGAFPVDPVLAWQLIAVSAATSALLGADKVVVKTPDEAVGIPTARSNAAAVRAVRYALDMVPALPLGSEVVEQERELITDEVETVLSTIVDLPAPSLVSQVHRAVRAGIIDVPFAPHEENAGELVADRGAGRRIRVREPGRVPLTRAQLRREHELRGAAPDAGGPLWEALMRDIRIFA